MFVDRFLLICKFLHFENNRILDRINSTNKIDTIQTVLQNSQKNCKTVHIPEDDIYINESLLILKGRLSWKHI